MYTEKDNKTINILGTEYSVIFVPEDNKEFEEMCADGTTDESVKEIKVGIFKENINTVRDLGSYQKKVLRHEIVHAFLHESGLAECSGNVNAWATNEEMVDWIAKQHAKLHKAFKEAGAL